MIPMQSPYRSQLAQSLIARGLNPGPIQHPTQTLGTLAQALVGGLMMKKENQAQQAQGEALAKALGSDPRIANDPVLQGLVGNPQFQAPIAGALVQSKLTPPEETETFSLIPAEEKAKLGLNPEANYQRSSITGKIFPVGSGSGVTVNVGPDGELPIGKNTANDLQGKLVESQMHVDRLRQINEGFDPSFLTIPGKMDAGWSAFKEKLGADLPAAERKKLADYTQFRATAFNELNQGIKSLTGAAMSEQEAGRLRKGLPDPEHDSPTEYQAKYVATLKDLTRAQAKGYYILRNGLSVDEVSLSDMDNIINQRGEELAQQAIADGATPEQAEALALQQLKREFGL